MHHLPGGHGDQRSSSPPSDLQQAERLDRLRTPSAPHAAHNTRHAAMLRCQQFDYGAGFPVRAGVQQAGGLT